MRVLIVEDDENKRKQLQFFFTEWRPDAHVTTSMSLQSGVRSIRSNTFDLVILDMTLPNYDAGPDEPGGGTVHSFGGEELLKQMRRLQIECPVIVVTQFEAFGRPNQSMGLVELDAKLEAQFTGVYRGAVYYHASLSDWKEKLKKKINEVFEQKD